MPKREPLVAKRLLPNIGLPRLKWLKRDPESRELPNVAPPKRELDIRAPPKAELPNRDPPNKDAPLRAAKFDSALADEIAEFSPPLVEVAPNERIPDETPLEAKAPPRRPDGPANECQPVGLIAPPRAPALALELKPRACPLPAPAHCPKPRHRPSAITEFLLAPHANRAFADPKPPARAPIRLEP